MFFQSRVRGLPRNHGTHRSWKSTILKLVENSTGHKPVELESMAKTYQIYNTFSSLTNWICQSRSIPIFGTVRDNVAYAREASDDDVKMALKQLVLGILLQKWRME